MHDRNGTPLRVGDVISVEYVITNVSSAADYCNVSAKSVLPRKPDGANEYFSGNTAVVTLVRRTEESQDDAG